MTKAKLVFESPGTFLSFPAFSPLTYPADRLRFTTEGTMSVQDLAELSEFARVTNVMPSGVIAPTTTDELLWEVCGDVLHTAEVADGTMSAEDQARYDAALAYLYSPSPAGRMSREDGPALLAYRRCRDAHIKALEDYKTRQLTAESAGDPRVTRQWEADEPKLRDVITELESTWATTGCRRQVEAAQQVELELGAQSPLRLWSEWKNALVDMIDMSTDTSHNEFAMTGFAPSDVFDGGYWPSFTLSGTEISALVTQAPPELAKISGVGATASDIEAVSFEYRSVSLVRPWFRPAMLRSRFWRLGPEGGELSDGAEPPSGRCPSYIAALVFARNIVVKRRAQPPAPVAGRALRDFVLLGPELVKGLPPVVVRDHRRPASIRARDHRRERQGIAVRDRQDALRRARGVLRKQVFAEMLRPSSLPSESTAAPSADVTVLAFICKKTPRCPDPDKSHSWPFSPQET